LNIPHIPVLIDEVVTLFKDIKNGYIVDCTVGYGGHSEAILKSNPNIKLICIDQDDEALNFSKKRLLPYKDRILFKKGRFSKILPELKDFDIRGVLADIGISSLQIDKRERGFGFDSHTLDMRMDQTSDFSAYDVVNGYCLDDLERILKEYGEIREYKKMASLIVKNRPIESAKELSSLIAKNFRSRKIHPATLAFQAIRIEVNSELDELSNLLKNLKNLNISNLLVAIITFHSLEDKIVKRAFKEWSQKCICPKEYIKCICGSNNSLGSIITKKPIIPKGAEIARNRRARSSKLRAFRFKE